MSFSATAPPAVASVQTGALQMYVGSVAPAGYLECDGSAVSRTTYAALFSKIGTAFGPGDGATTFNLPGFNSRLPMGRDGAGRTIGTTGGAEQYSTSNIGALTGGDVFPMADPGTIPTLPPFVCVMFIIKT